MPTANESSNHQGQMRAAIDSGIKQLSDVQKIVFQRYTRFPLASDGSVFWIATQQTIEAIGALHYATDRLQAEDETIGMNQMLFASESAITQFNTIDPSSMWIGSWPIAGAPPLRVVFSQRGNLFKEEPVWHYSGYAVYPALQTQIIENPANLPAGPIVSNSLPIWLAQTTFAGQTVPVYPSFLVPENIVPPYIVAHVSPEGTQALGSFPIIGPWPGVTEPNSGAAPLHQLASSQLMRDEVTLILYGFSNQMAQQYLYALIQNSIDDIAPFGFANSPAISDAKRTQVELSTLAQKKTIQISANYYQGAADVIARRLILEASISEFYFIGGVSVTMQGAIAQGGQVIIGLGSIFE